jgi:hypothetical protein
MTTWIHVFEQDTEEGAVFRPLESDIPLSRRPRARLELKDDGTATLWLAGADDRFEAQPGTWREEQGAIVITGESITARGGAIRLRVVERDTDRLVVQGLGRDGTPPGGARKPSP